MPVPRIRSIIKFGLIAAVLVLILLSGIRIGSSTGPPAPRTQPKTRVGDRNDSREAAGGETGVGLRGYPFAERGAAAKAAFETFQRDMSAYWDSEYQRALAQAEERMATETKAALAVAERVNAAAQRNAERVAAEQARANAVALERIARRQAAADQAAVERIGRAQAEANRLAVERIARDQAEADRRAAELLARDQARIYSGGGEDLGRAAGGARSAPGN